MILFDCHTLQNFSLTDRSGTGLIPFQTARDTRYAVVFLRIKTHQSLKIGMLIFKHIYEPDTLEIQLRNFFEIGRLYFQEQSGLDFLESIVTYIIKAAEIEKIKIVRAIKPITEKGELIVMTTAEKLRKEGRKEGHLEGRQEGSYNTLYATLQVMKKNGMSDEAIARAMNMELNLIKKVINKEEIEIPLHLLSQTNK